MFRLMLFIALMHLASVAHAETELEIGPGVCDTLVNHVPVPDATYQPGVDATGNPVVPADAGANPPLQVPKRFVITITDDLSARLAASAGGAAPTVQTPVGVAESQAFLGTITVDGNHLAYNGQKLGEDVDGELGKLCEEARGQ